MFWIGILNKKLVPDSNEFKCFFLVLRELSLIDILSVYKLTGIRINDLWWYFGDN